MGTFIVAVIVFGAAGAVAVNLWRKRKSGGCGCGCDSCSGCHK